MGSQVTARCECGFEAEILRGTYECLRKKPQISMDRLDDYPG
ncbi:hypothetical protein LCGC14_2906410, partial [marine sediment metagenome]